MAAAARRCAATRGSSKSSRAAGAGALLAALTCALRAHAAAPVTARELPVSVAGCADEMASALPALVSLEIDVLLRERAARGTPERIVVRCGDDAAQIEVALAGGRRTSTIALGALAPEHRARAVALAAAELVDAMSRPAPAAATPPHRASDTGRRRRPARSGGGPHIERPVPPHADAALRAAGRDRGVARPAEAGAVRRPPHPPLPGGPHRHAGAVGGRVVRRLPVSVRAGERPRARRRGTRVRRRLGRQAAVRRRSGSARRLGAPARRIAGRLALRGRRAVRFLGGPGASGPRSPTLHFTRRSSRWTSAPASSSCPSAASSTARRPPIRSKVPGSPPASRPASPGRRSEGNFPRRVSQADMHGK